MPDRPERLEAVVEIGGLPSNGESFQRQLHRILEQARRLTGAEAGTLWLREEDHLRLAVVQNDALAAGLGEHEADRRVHAETLGIDHLSPAGYAALSGDVLNIPNAYALSPDTPFAFNPALDLRTGYRTISALVAPLRDPPGTLVGVLQLINARNDAGAIAPFSHAHERLVSLLASNATVAIHHAQLYGQAEHRLRRAETLLAASEAIGSTLELTEVFRRTVRAIVRALGADMGVAWTLSPDLDQVIPLAGYRLPKDVLTAVTPTPVRQGDPLKKPIIDLQTPVHAAASQQDPRLDHPWARLVPHKSVLILPLRLKDATLGGFVIVWTREEHHVSPEELRLVEGIARQAALAIENARLYEELRRAHERLERSQAQLIHSEKLAALGQLVAGVAHELNNPLAVVLGHANLAERKEDLDNLRRHVTQMRVAAERAAEIVRNLLRFARKTTSSREAVDLDQCVERVLEIVANTLLTHKITLVRDSEPRIPLTTGDPGQLQQVLLNLVTNAVQAMPGGGTLTLRTRARAGWIRLEVADTGPGVAPEIRPKIFDPFFTTKPVGTGTGLGLSVAHGIVTAHAGRLWLDEAMTGGATFVLELPVQRPTPAPAAPAPVIPLGHRVLVVDDEVAVADVLGEQLKELGCDVVVVYSAAQARERLARERFDLVTLDLVMPEESGAQVWRHLRESLPEAARRVVFVSGAADPALEQFVESTGRPLLVKPVTLQTLAALLGEELNG